MAPSRSIPRRTKHKEFYTGLQPKRIPLISLYVEQMYIIHALYQRE